MKHLMIAAMVAVAGAASAQLWDNGPLSTGALTESGVAAPAGTTWSEVQHNVGDLTNANSVAGFSCFRNAAATSNFRLADDFTVGGGGWNVSGATFWAYRTTQPVGTSPFLAAYMQIWNGRPGDGGSAVVYGDTTTNVLTGSVFDNMYRTFNTVAPAASTPGTTRGIFQNDVSASVTLGPGTYWVDWTYTMTTDTFSSFTPSVTLPGTRGLATWNARQFNGATGLWADALDAGTPAAAADYLQDIAFQIHGTVVPEPGTFVAIGLGLAALAARRRRK